MQEDFRKCSQPSAHLRREIRMSSSALESIDRNQTCPALLWSSNDTLGLKKMEGGTMGGTEVKAKIEESFTSHPWRKNWKECPPQPQANREGNRKVHGQSLSRIITIYYLWCYQSKITWKLFRFTVKEQILGKKKWNFSACIGFVSLFCFIQSQERI